MQLGDSSITAVTSHGTFTTTSDSRFKVNVNETVPGLSFIKQLRPVTYNMDMQKMAEILCTPDKNVQWMQKMRKVKY